MRAVLTGRYLTTDFRIEFQQKDQLFREVHAFLAPHLRVSSKGDCNGEWRIEVNSINFGVDLGSKYSRDRCGSFLHDEPNAGRRTYAVDRSVDPVEAAQDIYCGVRRLALQSCSEVVLLHAAAIHVDARTILFVGPKAAGKSTVLFTALLGSGAALVSSDKLVLRNSFDNKLISTSLVESIRVSQDNLRFLEPSTSNNQFTAYCHQPANWAGAKLQNGKLAISPHLMQQLIGRPMVLESQPSAVVVLDGKYGPPRLDAGLDAAMVQAELEQNMLDDIGRFECGLKNDKVVEKEFVRKLLTQCTIYRLRGKPNRSQLLAMISDLVN